MKKEIEQMYPWPLTVKDKLFYNLNKHINRIFQNKKKIKLTHGLN